MSRCTRDAASTSARSAFLRANAFGDVGRQQDGCGRTRPDEVEDRLVRVENGTVLAAVRRGAGAALLARSALHHGGYAAGRAERRGIEVRELGARVAVAAHRAVVGCETAVIGCVEDDDRITIVHHAKPAGRGIETTLTRAGNAVERRAALPAAGGYRTSCRKRAASNTVRLLESQFARSTVAPLRVRDSSRGNLPTLI